MSEIKPGTPIEAVVAVAGREYNAATLRRAADGVQFFFDEATESLIYRGPMPPDEGARVLNLDGPVS